MCLESNSNITINLKSTLYLSSRYAMMWGGGGHWGVYWYQLPYYSTSAADVHYVKCFDSTSATPLNKRRLQFPSQYNTYELDPAVPEYYPWNGTGWESLARLLAYAFSSWYHSFHLSRKLIRYISNLG